MATPQAENPPEKKEEYHPLVSHLSGVDGYDPLKSYSFTSKAGINQEGHFTLDSLLEQIGFGSFHIKRFLAAGAMAFMDGAVVMTLSLSLVILETEWGFGSTTESVVASIAFASIVLGAYLAGPIADKYGRRVPMIISCGFICILNLASAFTTEIYSYTALRALLAFGCGFYAPIGFTYVLEIMPPSIRGKVVTVAYAMMFIGELFACVVSLYALDSLSAGNWQALTIWSTLPAIVSLMLSIAYMDESVRFLLISKKFNQALIQLKISAEESWSHEKVEITEDVTFQLKQWLEFQDLAKSKNPPQPGIRVLLNKRFRKITLINWLVWFAISFSYYGLTIFFPYILNVLTEQEEASGLSSDLVALSGSSLTGYTISIGLESISVVISYFVIDSQMLGRKKGMMLFFGISSLFALLAFVNRTIVGLVVWTTVLRITLDVCFFYSYLLALEAYPTKIRATGVGAAMAFGKAGTVLMPWVCSLLLEVDTFGPYISFFVLCTVAAIATLWLPPEISKREMQ